MDFEKEFDATTAFLRSQGVEPAIKRSPAATPEDVARFHASTGVELPAGFADFYSFFANGYEFTWNDGDESGSFSMPDLARLAELKREWSERVTGVADDPGSMDRCMEPEFREEAFRIWGRMKSWLPFIEEPDGDAFCLDIESGMIVFDKHDWFDGFGEIAETNGMIAGLSLADFIQTWSRFSFMSMWFTDAPHPAGQLHLEWDSNDSRFER